MTRRFRRFLFLLIAAIFLVAAPLIILYSFGWRFDWQTKKIIQVGLFYFKAWPKSADILIDEKLEKKTDFLFGSAVVENLAPKKYDIEIKKEGFHSWQKNLEIRQKMATEITNVVLAPENPIFTNLSAGVKNFYFLPSEDKVILEEKTILNPKKPLEESWALKLFDLKKNLKSQLITETSISKTAKSEINDIKISSDSKTALIEVALNEELQYYLLDINSDPIVLTPLDFLGQNIDGVYSNPKDPQKLFISKAGTISEADLLTKKVSSPILKDIVTLSFNNDGFYYLDKSGFVSETNFYFENQNKLNLIPFSVKNETAYKLEVSLPNVVLLENNSLYFLNSDKVFEKIFEPVTGFRFSPDHKKLAFFNDNEIGVLFLEKTSNQFPKEKGDKISLGRFSDKISDIFWWTDYYLIFNSGSKIKISEIDDRDKINIIDFADFKDSKIFWSKTGKKLYILSNSDLFASDKIVP